MYTKEVENGTGIKRAGVCAIGWVEVKRGRQQEQRNSERE